MQPAAVSDFPSLDQMAAVSKEQRSASRPANRAAFAAAFPATSSNYVPSSLPRPAAQVHRVQPSDADENQRQQRAARSSLTNGAIQRARQQAGDETPLGVSQARAARQAAIGTSSKANSSLLADDSGDSTAQLIPGRRDAATNPVLANIDVENPQMPSLSQTTPAAASTSQPSQSNKIEAAASADVSASSQASIFGTGKRRNGADQPIGGTSAGTAYDFSKYLDGELDPFNRASRANPRRESRPLPVQQMPADDEDEAEISGDTTARGALSAPSNPVSTTAPVESTPLISRVKATASATPRMSPHASPSVSSRKLAHLSSLSNGHATPTAGNAAQSAVGDASTASLASHNRFDPSARTDRLQTMELGELRKKHALLARELAAAQDALESAKEESEGWASECTGLQEQLTTLKSNHQAAMAREARARAELQVRLSQYKIEADDRAWKLLAQRRQASLIDVALQHAKNEATYHEGRYHATESEFEGQKDELRIRLMLERKRADLLALHAKAAMRDGARLKKRLIAKTTAFNELQSENERLAEELEEARSSRHAGGKDEAAALRQQLAEAQAEIETLNERDAMMAETRKTWKAERKQLLAQIEELSSAPASGPISKVQQPVKVARPAKVSKPVVASQMLPPSSPVYTKKKSRQPMQGASELGPPSEEDYDDGGAMAAPPARKATTAKTTLPLVPFAHMSSKTTAPKKAGKQVKAVSSSKTKASKDWRAITDSSEEDSDDGHNHRRRGRRAGNDSDSEQDSDDGRRSKSKPTKKSSKTSSAPKTKPNQTKRSKPAPPIDYNDQTADPSATPIIRSNKRNVPQAAGSEEDEAAVDSSVLGAKFGRDRTNFTLAPKSKVAKTSTAAAQDGQKKKKRKLLGGGGAMQWGAAGAGGEGAGLAPNFDIPLELSPIKGGAAGGRGGGGAGAALLAGLGMPTRNPFM